MTSPSVLGIFPSVLFFNHFSVRFLGFLRPFLLSPVLRNPAVIEEQIKWKNFESLREHVCYIGKGLVEHKVLIGKLVE